MKESTKYTIIAVTATALWWFFRRRANQSQTNLSQNTLPHPVQNKPVVLSTPVEKPDTTDQAELERPLVLLYIRDGVTRDDYPYKYQQGAFLIDNKKIIYMEVKGNNDTSINTFTNEVRIGFEQEAIKPDREAQKSPYDSPELGDEQKTQEFPQSSIKRMLSEHPDALIISFDYFGSTDGQVSIQKVKSILFDGLPLQREGMQKYFQLERENSFYQATLVVDPTSDNSAPHWYPQVTATDPKIEVSTANGTGSVEAELRYRGPVVDGPKSAVKGGVVETIWFGNTGQGTYELRVHGTNTGKYKVSGTWKYGYDDTAPVSNISGLAQ